MSALHFPQVSSCVFCKTADRLATSASSGVRERRRWLACVSASPKSNDVEESLSTATLSGRPSEGEPIVLPCLMRSHNILRVHAYGAGLLCRVPRVQVYLTGSALCATNSLIHHNIKQQRLPGRPRPTFCVSASSYICTSTRPAGYHSASLPGSIANARRCSRPRLGTPIGSHTYVTNTVTFSRSTLRRRCPCCAEGKSRQLRWLSVRPRLQH